MIKVLAVACLLMLSCTGFSQTLNQQDSSWIVDNYYKLEKSIPMRDGVKLFTSIYIPKDTTEEHPMLMTRTPYSCAPYGEKKFKTFWDTHLKYYMREGYIMITQDVRGRWMSEGDFVDVRPFQKDKKSSKETDEASDTYDTVDWMVKNVSHNNGKVGVFGISYPGFYSTMAAASNHPALKAVSPQAPVTDWFMGDDFHHNGAFFQMDGFAFYSSFGQPRIAPTIVGPKGFEYTSRDNYSFYLKSGTLQGLQKLIGDSIAFWKELYQHPNYDAWWKARNARSAMFNIHPAMMVVGGLFDAEDCFGAWNLYKAIESQSPATNNRLVMGPWYHGQWARADGSSLGNVRFGSRTSEWYQNNVEIPFFDYYLKGKGPKPDLAKATIFFTGENKWRKLKQWPPAEEKEQLIYFQSDEGLSWNKPKVKSSATKYVSDPAHPVPYTQEVHLNRTREYMTDDQRFASRRPDVLSFVTEELTEDLTLAGPVKADLKVSTTGTDADFVVKVVDVYPDSFNYPNDVAQIGKSAGGSYVMGGYQMLVRGEIMRGRFRHSFEKPEPFVPGKIEQVAFTLPDVAHTFKKGHRLMIQIQSSWYPLVDRNPQKFVNIYTADEKDFQKAMIKVYHDADNSSSISLPVLK